MISPHPKIGKPSNRSQHSQPNCLLPGWVETINNALFTSKYGAKGIDSVLKSVFGDSSNKGSNAGVLTLKSLVVGASFNVPIRVSNQLVSNVVVINASRCLSNNVLAMYS